MSINILEHNPYLDVLQIKAARVQEYEEFKEIAMVMDYTESKQMTATISGKAEVSGDLPTKEEIEIAKKASDGKEDPLDVMRRIAEEEGYLGRDDDDDDDDDWDDDGDLDAV